MAAYNSEKEIGRALESIRSQTVDQNLIEILVVDGGSKDKTIDIAKSYGAKVIKNPYRLPEPAKMIGLKEAKGKYILIMDTDETFCSNDILEKRLNALENIHGLRSIQGGVHSPKNEVVGHCSRYINEVGDPFTCFVYKTYKGGSMPGVIKRSGTYDKEHECFLGHFSKDDIKPIGDSVTMMDREYILKHYKYMIDEGCTTAAIYDRLVGDTGITAFVDGDYNIHYSSSSFKTYFGKLKFRIINNIFDVKGSGYSAAAQTNKKLRNRKYLFPLYTASTIIPVVHGIEMSMKYKHPVFLMHPIFAWYVIIEIMIQYTKKIFGKKSVNKNYAR